MSIGINICRAENHFSAQPVEQITDCTLNIMGHTNQFEKSSYYWYLEMDLLYNDVKWRQRKQWKKWGSPWQKACSP